MRASLWLFLAIVSNCVAVYFIPESQGFTRARPVFLACVSIVLTQFFIALAVNEGGQLGISIAIVIALVMVFSALVDWYLKGEKAKPTVGQWVGYAVAIAGVFLARYFQK